MGLDIEITDTDILKKIIELLSCVIHGHSVRALLRKDTKFLSEKTNADLIVLYIKKNEGQKIDYITDKRRLFGKLLEKYDFNKYSPAFKEVGREIIDSLNSLQPYRESKDIHDFLKGTVTKHECKKMGEEINFTTSFFFPLKLRCGIKIGFVSYYFTRDKKPDLQKMKEVTTMFQRLIEPLYDPITTTFYSKCAQIDSEMSRLTDKEREIVHRVMKGMSYSDISQELKITINTLKTHMKSVFSKYGVSSKMELNNRLLMHVKKNKCH